MFFEDRHPPTGSTAANLPGGLLAWQPRMGGHRLIITENTRERVLHGFGRDNGGINNTDFLQRLAMSKGTIHADSRGVWFTGFRTHRIIANADGGYYPDGGTVGEWRII